MDAHSSAEMVSFGQEHFGNCDLGDKRSTARLVFTTDRFLGHPGGTLPDKLNNNADLVGFYRLANNPKVTHAKLMDAHRARTRELMERCPGIVLVIHDTTEIDFSGLESVDDLGPIGHGGCSGYLCHNSLAYDYQAGEVLGLANQTIHVRRKVPKGESPRAKREHPQRESRLWKKGWMTLTPPPPGQLRVNLADRGADMFEFIQAVQKGADYYVIRSKSNRNIELDDGRGGVTAIKLHGFARTLAPLGTRSVEVSTNHGRKGRTAGVRVAAAKVTIKAPHFARGEHSKENLSAWVVHVIETDPPKGETALEWILLTNVPTDNFADACRRVDWYACRPIIEEFHKAAKTGCGIELPQFTTGHALQVTIAVLSVVATQLLRLRDLARREDAKERPASDVVDEEYATAASAWRFKEIRSNLSVHDFCMALAKLGGHLNRKHDGPPGWLVLWRGWTKLQLLVEGARIGRIMRCV
jgi:Transposase DNA-binding